MNNTVRAAIGKWKGILIALGVDDNFLRDKHGPCPFCAGTDRFRFDDKDGRGTWICSQCGAGNGFDFAMRWLDKSFAETARAVDEIVGTVIAVPQQKAKQDPAIRLREIYRGCTEAKGTLVENYLSSRGLTVPEVGIMYHPKLAYFNDGRLVDHWPAMVAVVSDKHGQPNTLHVTYLTPDGRKQPVTPNRKIMTPKAPMAGGAVRLSEAGKTLGIAEGIETALAASVLESVPVWAATNATMLSQFEPPTGTDRLIIYGDNDANFTGQKAAYELANRLTIAGLEVVVMIPARPGDWNDELINLNRMVAA